MVRAIIIEYPRGIHAAGSWRHGGFAGAARTQHDAGRVVYTSYQLQAPPTTRTAGRAQTQAVGPVGQRQPASAEGAKFCGEPADASKAGSDTRGKQTAIRCQ